MKLDTRNRAKLMKHRLVLDVIHARDEAQFSRAVGFAIQLEAEIKALRDAGRPFAINDEIGCGEFRLFEKHHARLWDALAKKNRKLALARGEVETTRAALSKSTQRKEALKKICDR